MLKNIFLFGIVLSLGLASLGCGLTIDLPVDRIATGPLQTENFDILAPNAEVVDVRLNFGAGEMMIVPGVGEALISGSATYNVEDFKPEIKVEGAQVTLEMGNLELTGIPDINNADNVKNIWNLGLGSHPMNLRIQAGAYEGIYELGGLALKSLEISDGAANSELRFSKPNLLSMETLRYTTGASSVSLSGLANANFTSMIFRSGAGNYTLDFGGALQRDGVVTIESGMSEVTLIVPEGVNTRLIFKGGLASVETSGSWQQSGDQYLLPGSGPLLTINVDIGAGNLVLRTS